MKIMTQPTNIADSATSELPTIDTLIKHIASYANLQTTDLNQIRTAYDIASQAHQHQTRDSGELYIHHPLSVALILAELRLDAASIITALLHDTVEDTSLTLKDIETEFGPTISRLVDGVSKLSQIEMGPKEVQQAENFRKLILAMSTDIRVLLVKLADRLHNMRTIHHITNSERRQRIATETLEVYARLADRIGLQSIKDELEDLAFHVLNPDMYETISNRLNFLHHSSENIIETILTDIERDLNEANIKSTVSGRIKTPYSIWMKMQKKHIAFEQLADIMAFRVIVSDVAACYHTLGVLHNRYRVVPERFKDYISTPKTNEYQSLHTGIIGSMHTRIEVQIRTQDMHDVAEMGVAAHWSYKDESHRHDGRQYAWLRRILDILDQAEGAQDFFEHTKLEMFQDQVFCFTPKGTLIALPKGATTIDFAYAIHSNVGDHAVGAKINGKAAPLRTVLHNGDQVEIQTSPKQTPSPTWERFVVTGRARAHIRRFVRAQQRDQFIQLGKSIIHKTFRKAHVSLSERELETLLSNWHLETLDDLYATIGEGRLHTAREAFDLLHPHTPQENKTPEVVLQNKKERNEHVSISGLIPGMAIHFAGCCHPLKGDDIIGIVITGTGVTIHTRDCEQGKQVDPNATIDLSWGVDDKDETHVGRIRVTFVNKKGALAALTQSISKNDGNIVNMKITHRSEEFWDMFIDIEVRDAPHLQLILAVIRSHSIITRAARD